VTPVTDLNWGPEINYVAPLRLIKFIKVQQFHFEQNKYLSDEAEKQWKLMPIQTLLLSQIFKESPERSLDIQSVAMITLVPS